jgi:hypothetical protein
VVPNAAPAPPVLTASRISTTRVDIAFTAPNNNGATITRYTASTSPATVTQTLDQSGGGTFSFTVLSPGVSYTFSVYATNANGDGTAGTVSSYTAGVPGTPTNISVAAASPTSANVYFSAPSDTGGPAITSYTATSNPDNQVASSSGSPVTVSNLIDGRSYTFSVYATNSIGNSSSVGPSNAITTPLGTYQAQFDGTTNTQLYVGADLSFAANQDFTVECWAYRRNGTTHNFWSIGTNTTLRLQLQSNLFEVFGGFISKPFTPASINAWHHYAMVRSGSTITVYVDGGAVTSATYAGVLGNTGPMYIGTRSDGNVNRLLGYMSNVRVVRGTAVYTGGFSPPTGNLGIVGDTTLLTCQNSYAVDNSNYRRGIDNSNVSFAAFAGY